MPPLSFAFVFARARALAFAVAAVLVPVPAPGPLSPVAVPVVLLLELVLVLLLGLALHPSSPTGVQGRDEHGGEGVDHPHQPIQSKTGMGNPILIYPLLFVKSGI